MSSLTKSFLLALAAAATTTQAAAVGAFSGDMTYYAPGLGACGEMNTASDAIVAVAPAQYGSDANPNNAAVCGEMIRISYNGKTATATVRDKCPECASGSIDVSPALFTQLAAEAQGRVQVTWEYVQV
ncbi:barwin-like endoglucanase [Xylariomycetidae sp. FL2044]|nr:barwin-like endoglucanase [Xylariomycetidae sp. FL2044]